MGRGLCTPSRPCQSPDTQLLAPDHRWLMMGRAPWLLGFPVPPQPWDPEPVTRHPGPLICEMVPQALRSKGCEGLEGRVPAHRGLPASVSALT